MAQNKWTGGANDGNWSTAGNWSLGAAPVDTNDVVIDVTSQAITAGLNQTTIDLASLTISSGVSIGAPGSSLIIGITGTYTHTGTGTIYIAADAADSNPIDKAVIKSTFGGAVYFTGGTVTLLEIGRQANVYVNNGCTVVTARSDGGGATFEANGTGITTLEQGDGSIICARNIATGTIAGANTLLTTTGTAAISTLLTVAGGALFNHKSSGTITNIKVMSRSQATSNGNPYNFTVTNGSAWRTSDIFGSDQESSVITYTNPLSDVA